MQEFCKTWKLSKPPSDAEARKSFNAAWGSGCSKSADECQEVPTFRLKQSAKSGEKFFLIQRRGKNRNVVGPVTMDGKSCLVLHRGKEFNATCQLSGDGKEVVLTMEDRSGAEPLVKTTHTLLKGGKDMGVKQEAKGTPLIEATFTAVDNHPSKEDDEL